MRKLFVIFILMLFTGTTFASIGINNLVNAENIFFEGFEEGIMPPSGWYLEESNPDLGWFIGDQNVLNGSFCAWINFDNSNEKDNWLISPNFDLSVYGEVYLDFWGKSDTNYPGATVEVHIRGDGFDDVVWDLIGDEYWDFFDWYEIQIDLSSYAGEIINLSWRYIGRGGESFGLDDIRLFGFVNAPPSIPTINGKEVGKPGESYDYNVMSIDPEGDEVTYCIDWGDGTPEVCYGPYDSRTEQTFSHIWEEKGDFIIRVKARDSNGAESEWGTLEVSMPKGKSIIPFGTIIVFGFDVDIKIVQLEPGEDYVDLEVLNKPFYIWENGIETRNPGEFIRLYTAKGLFSSSLSFCFGTCDDWGIIG